MSNFTSEIDDDELFNDYKNEFEADKNLINLAYKKGQQEVVDLLIK